MGQQVAENMRTGWRVHARRTWIAAVLVGIPWLMIEFLPAPCVWLFLFWGACLATRGIRRRRALAFNLGILFFALSAGEVYLWVTKPKRAEFGLDYYHGYIEPHDYLGYVAIPGAKTRSFKTFDGTKLYDVEYTIGNDGLRVAPPVDPSAKHSLLFFGGSFTIGEGLEDEQTLPYRVGSLLAGRYQVHNFGLHGYGPHQMLSALEHGRVAEIAQRPPSHAFYFAISRHVGRVHGFAAWDRDGPRYVLDADGGARLDGRFEQPSRIYRFFRRLGRKSFIGRRLLARGPPTDEQIELYTAVVETARNRIAAAWPACEFHVLLWDSYERNDEVRRALETKGIRVHVLSSLVFPGLDEQALPYQIHQSDEHPTAESIEKLARYVVDKIVAPR